MTVNSQKRLRFAKYWFVGWCLWFGILACTLSPIKEPRLVYVTETPLPIVSVTTTRFPPPAPIATTISTAIPTISPTTVILPLPYTDATYLLNDVCFDALLPIIGNYLMLDSQAALDQFWGSMNVSTACGRSVRNPTFDFSTQVLVGTVRLVQGCTANFIPQAIEWNDATGQVVVPAQFEINSNCDYQLAVSFLVGIPRPPSGYTVTLDILTE